MTNFVVLCTLHEETIVCYRTQPLFLRIRLGCRLLPELPTAAVSGPGGGWAAGHPASCTGAGMAFEFRFGAEVMIVTFVSICYYLSGKLCPLALPASLDPSTCVVSGHRASA